MNLTRSADFGPPEGGDAGPAAAPASVSADATVRRAPARDPAGASPSVWELSRAGFTRALPGQSHRYAIFAYFGTANLSLREFGPLDPDTTTVMYRRAADLIYDRAEATTAARSPMLTIDIFRAISAAW